MFSPRLEEILIHYLSYDSAWISDLINIYLLLLLLSPTGKSVIGCA